MGGPPAGRGGIPSGRGSPAGRGSPGPRGAPAARGPPPRGGGMMSRGGGRGAPSPLGGAGRMLPPRQPLQQEQVYEDPYGASAGYEETMVKIIFEPCSEKTGFLHMRKQRRRSASR